MCVRRCQLMNATNTPRKVPKNKRRKKVNFETVVIETDDSDSEATVIQGTAQERQERGLQDSLLTSGSLSCSPTASSTSSLQESPPLLSSLLPNYNSAPPVLERTDHSQVNFLADVSPRRLELLERRLTDCNDPGCFCTPVVINDRLTKNDVKDLCVQCIRDNLVQMWETSQCATDRSLRSLRFTLDFKPSAGFELNLRDNSGAATDSFYEAIYAHILDMCFTDTVTLYVFASDVTIGEPLSQVAHTQVAIKLLGSAAQFTTYRVVADVLYLIEMVATFPGTPNIFDHCPTSPCYSPTSPPLPLSPLFPIDNRNVSFPPDYAMPDLPYVPDSPVY